VKILIINSLQYRSSAAMRGFNIAKELSNLGHRVSYIEPTLSQDQRENIGLVNLIKTRYRDPLPVGLGLSFLGNCYRSLSEKPNVVIALKVLPTSCFPALLNRTVCGSKIILDIDDMEFLYRNNSTLSWIESIHDRAMPRLFDKVSVHCQALHEFARNSIGLKEEDVLWLHQGIEYDKFQGVERDPSLQQKYGLEGFKVIFYSAHLGVATSLAPVLQMMKLLINKRQDFKLLIAGGGSLKNHYIALAKQLGIADHVCFTGYVHPKDLQKYMVLGDVAINYLEEKEVNKYRALIKIREYLACGVPVVANLVADTALFSKYIYSYKTEDLNEFASQICAATDDPDLEKTALGKEHVRQNFDWPKVVQKFNQQLLGIL
jgi:glycosyltransferase involved in cell wall biosynthesis